MSKFYSVIHIFGVLFLLRINYCDAVDIKYYDYNARYLARLYELPYDSTGAAFWARGEPCRMGNSGFTCCTSLMVHENTLVPICTKFMKKNVEAWTLDLVMNNEKSIPIVQYADQPDGSACEPVANNPNIMFCVSFSSLERTTIRVNFTTTRDGLTYGLYFDEINYEVDPTTPQPIDKNPTVQYFKRGSEIVEPYNPPEPGKVLTWADGGRCDIACCADYKGPGTDIWANYCAILIRKSAHEWYFTEKSRSSNGYRVPVHDLGENPNGRTCFFISDNTIDKFCVRFETDFKKNTTVSFETTIGESTYELRFEPYDFGLNRHNELPRQAPLPKLSDYYYYYSF